jgi:GT2 family glycosyltransferase
MTFESPEVAVILVNYNSSRHTLNCVRALRERTALPDYEIVVVDNHSRPEEFELLAPLQALPRVNVFRSWINLGFSGGNTLGVQFASPSADYYFFLNNDCVVLNDVVSILATFLKDHPRAGVATGQMYSPDMARQASFGHFPSLGGILFGRGLMRLFDKELYRSSRTEYRAPVTVPYVTGCAMFVRKEPFVRLGGFDTSYFLYCEEEDLCMGMRRHGWDTYLVPEARFVHHGGASTVQGLAIEREFYISFLYFLRKFYSWPSRVMIQLFYVVKLLRKTFRASAYARLGWFVLRGAPAKSSLRFRQV